MKTTNKLPFQLSFVAFGVGAMLSFAPLAKAAVITWGSATDVVSTLDVSTNGTTVEAFNIGYEYTGAIVPTPPALSTVTVNSVIFAALAGPSPLTETNGGAYGFLAGKTTGNTDYNSLLNSAAYGGGTGTVDMTLGGGNLVNGQQYEIQLWYVDVRTEGVDTRAMIFGDGEITESSVSVSSGIFGPSGTLGQYTIGTFTADGINQTLSLTPGVAPNAFGNSQLNAYQIRAVPEPSAASLVGLCGLALILRRRR